MANTTGSGSAKRTVAGVGTTSGAKGLTGSAGSFSARDVGAAITGTNIPAGNTIASVTSDTVATMGGSNATGTGSVSATIGPRKESSSGFTGWRPETDARASDYTFASAVAGTAPLDRLGDNITRTNQFVEH